MDALIVSRPRVFMPGFWFFLALTPVVVACLVHGAVVEALIAGLFPVFGVVLMLKCRSTVFRSEGREISSRARRLSYDEVKGVVVAPDPVHEKELGLWLSLQPLERLQQEVAETGDAPGTLDAFGSAWILGCGAQRVARTARRLAKLLDVPVAWAAGDGFEVTPARDLDRPIRVLPMAKTVAREGATPALPTLEQEDGELRYSSYGTGYLWGILGCLGVLVTFLIPALSVDDPKPGLIGTILLGLLLAPAIAILAWAVFKLSAGHHTYTVKVSERGFHHACGFRRGKETTLRPDEVVALVPVGYAETGLARAHCLVLGTRKAFRVHFKRPEHAKWFAGVAWRILARSAEEGRPEADAGNLFVPAVAEVLGPLEKVRGRRHVLIKATAGFVALLLAFYGVGSVEKARLTAKDAESAWFFVEASPTEAKLEEFIERFPDTEHADEARRMLAALPEERAWSAAEDEDTAAAMRGYLEEHPRGAHAEEARRRLEWLPVREDGSVEAMDRFLQEHPESPHADDARDAIASAYRERFAGEEDQPSSTVPSPVEVPIRALPGRVLLVNLGGELEARSDRGRSSFVTKRRSRPRLPERIRARGLAEVRVVALRSAHTVATPVPGRDAEVVVPTVLWRFVDAGDGTEIGRAVISVPAPSGLTRESPQQLDWTDERGRTVPIDRFEFFGRVCFLPDPVHLEMAFLETLRLGE